MVVEDATKVVTVVKDVRLVREVCAAGVDEVDAWEAWQVSVYLAESTPYTVLMYGTNGSLEQ